MKFFEFGKENEKSLFILCGYLAKWSPGLMPFISEASKKYHVIVQAYDGFNENEKEKCFNSIVREAEYAADYIYENLNAYVDILYGISMGGMVANEIIMDKRIKVHTFIADGYTILPMPKFKNSFIQNLYVKGYSNLIYSVLTKHQGFLAKLLGRTKESISESLYTDVSKETIRNSVISEIGYRYKYESFNYTDSYVFHGTAERVAAAKVHKLKKDGINFTHKMFRNVGHGGLIHMNPRKLLNLIDKAYKGELRAESKPKD
ncbi:MAG: hypothetical protein K6E10_04275 [Eubacterium sp.]|nr:hypothetical protein [Eubacterium sp.]